MPRWQPPPSSSFPPRRWQPARNPTWIVVLLVAGAAWAYGEWSKQRAPEGDAVSGLARAADGDSLEIDGQRIRLFGIDAPELRQLCRGADGSETTCGVDARDTLAGFIRGKVVTCAPQEAERSYDRLVAICRAGSEDLSEAMIRHGYAIELPSHSKGRYAAAEREAKNAKRGIWAGNFERPGEWRARMGR